MTGKRMLTCIVCPLGCRLEVSFENGEIKNIAGNNCKRGVSYAQTELTNPTRMLTTTVVLDGGHFPVVPVKSDKSLPKGLLLECMKVVNGVKLSAPVRIGDIVVQNILGTGVNIIVTKNIDKKSAV